MISTGTGSLDAVKKILSLQEKEIDAKQFYSDWKHFHRRHFDEANKNAFVNEEEIFNLDLKNYMKNMKYEETMGKMLR